MKKIRKCQAVVFVDELGADHDALLTAIHGKLEFDEALGGDAPCVNLIYVVLNEKQRDQYGQQTEHKSSVVHKTSQGVGGNYWRFADEAPWSG